MADIRSIFRALLQGANPDSPPEDINAQADKLSQHPDATDAVKPFMGNPSDFDVHVSDNTVTQNGAANSLSSQIPRTPPATAVATPVSLPSSTSLPTAVSSGPSSAPNKSTSISTPPPPTATTTPPSPLGVSSNDAADRDAMMAQAIQNRKNAVIPTAIAGAGDAVATGLKAFGINAPTDKQAQLVELAKKNFEESKGLFEEKLRHDPDSDVSKGYRDMVTQIAPTMAKDPNFQNLSAQDIGDKLPLIDTMMKAKASEDTRKAMLAQAQSYKDVNIGLRQDQQQDKLEQNARQMVANLRGDKSLARTEEQRDAAAVAYNRLKEIQASGKEPNPVDYVDVLGQIYKARTGTAPGEQIMNDIRQSTAKGKLGQVYTFITGQQAPATTRDITNSLLGMAQSMGKQADAFHDGYMKAHLIKPAGLDDERWQPILQTNRGMSFAEATKKYSQPANNSSQAPNTQTIEGKSYVQDPSTGKWHEAQ